MLDFEAIRKIMPTRFPLIMIDKVVHITKTRAVGLKNITGNEIFFMGHFPDKAVVPGAMIIEGIGQMIIIAACCSGKKIKKINKTPYLGSVKCRFYHIVVPGDVLRYEIDLIRKTKVAMYVKAKVFVEEKLIAEGEMISSTGKKSG